MKASCPIRIRHAFLFLAFCTFSTRFLYGGVPDFVEDQFDLPDGFRIYRAAEPELAGGSYDIAFDGQGRLLVGDGEAVRRLVDDNNDGIFDRYTIIATDLGWRGPQGLLVSGDSLFAVGGDGLQRFSGYETRDRLRHEGRVGTPFNTGGDHTAHTILKGLDGFIYLVVGDGAGAEGERHITHPTSPVLKERAACVFRISPDGQDWECVSAGGRNPPNLGMNEYGDLFSWDSDMEWHVDLPWYRPLRLNLWPVGGDLGWKGVGALPPYYPDTTYPVLETGRGSPDWGVFYWHHQFPEDYQDRYFVCDYLWKSASSGRYNTVGRLVAFDIKPQNGAYTAEMEVFARPKPGAMDALGRPINFALVDVDVAPDGSLFISDHNQGVWRIYYDPSGVEIAPPINSPLLLPPRDAGREIWMNAVLDMPQPESEWTQVPLRTAKNLLNGEWTDLLVGEALNADRDLDRRLKAIRLLAHDFNEIPVEFLMELSSDQAWQVRAIAAWLHGLGATERSCSALLFDLLKDPNPFVRRKAAEALNRTRNPDSIRPLLLALNDPDRSVGYAAMTALSRHETGTWMSKGLESSDPMVLIRSLTALHSTGSKPDMNSLSRVWTDVSEEPASGIQTELDFYRVTMLYSDLISDSPSLSKTLEARLQSVPAILLEDIRIRLEQATLIARFKLNGLLERLLVWFEETPDSAERFHYASCLAKVESGFSEEQRKRLVTVFMQTQSGWFADYMGKGYQFPDFWSAVLVDFVEHNAEVILKDFLSEVKWSSALGMYVLDVVLDQTTSFPDFISIYGSMPNPELKARVLGHVDRFPSAETVSFLKQEFETSESLTLKAAAVLAMSKLPDPWTDQEVLKQGLVSDSVDLALACVKKLANLKYVFQKDDAEAMIRMMRRNPSAAGWMGQGMRLAFEGDHPEWLKRERDEWPEEWRDRIIDYWMEWYQDRFGEALIWEGFAYRSNEDLFEMILSTPLDKGSHWEGRSVYYQLQCAQCHGGDSETDVNARLFGPDLIGVTSRLSKQELVESLVYPSKQVAERFKATEIELKDGAALTGFITEETDSIITLSTQERVHRLERNEVSLIRPQESSLMPEGLLNIMGTKQIQDLMAYLHYLGREIEE